MNLMIGSGKISTPFENDQTPLNLLLAERRRALETGALLIKDAQELAQQIESEARCQADAIRRQAQEAGHQEGRAAVAKQVAQAARWQATIIEKTRPEIIRLAIEIARRILRQEIQASPEIIVDIFREVIRENAPGKRITLVVHPEDMKLLAQDSQLLASAEQHMAIRLEASEKLQRGECLVRSELGQVDGRLSMQLEELRIMLEGCDVLGLNRS